MSHTKEILNLPIQDENNQPEEAEFEVNLYDINRSHLCNHEFHDGAFCQMVAPSGEEFCRWHSTAADRIARRCKYEKRRSKMAIKELVIPTIEDSYSLQVAIHAVMDAIIDGRADHGRAGHLLYALQISQNNIRGQFRFPRTRFSEFNLEEFLQDQLRAEREAQKQREEQRKLKKPPQSVQNAPKEAIKP